MNAGVVALLLLLLLLLDYMCGPLALAGLSSMKHRFAAAVDPQVAPVAAAAAAAAEVVEGRVEPHTSCNATTPYTGNAHTTRSMQQDNAHNTVETSQGAAGR
jgi:hypothetical protein